jgi:hypothetical protein
VPKFGVPSAFHVNYCALVVRSLPQRSVVESLAW